MGCLLLLFSFFACAKTKTFPLKSHHCLGDNVLTLCCEEVDCNCSKVLQMDPPGRIQMSLGKEFVYSGHFLSSALVILHCCACG